MKQTARSGNQNCRTGFTALIIGSADYRGPLKRRRDGTLIAIGHRKHDTGRQGVIQAGTTNLQPDPEENN